MRRKVKELTRILSIKLQILFQRILPYTLILRYIIIRETMITIMDSNLVQFTQILVITRCFPMLVKCYVTFQLVILNEGNLNHLINPPKSPLVLVKDLVFPKDPQHDTTKGKANTYQHSSYGNHFINNILHHREKTRRHRQMGQSKHE